MLRGVTTINLQHGPLKPSYPTTTVHGVMPEGIDLNDLNNNNKGRQ